MIKNRYVVISYDDDQQQIFWDWVLATDFAAAMDWVGKRRPYAVPVECLTPADLICIGQVGLEADDTMTEATMQDLTRQAIERGDILEEEPCEPF